MFGRFTDSAKRALFFARYEASQFGAIVIDTEYLLLGVMRESKGLTGRILEHFLTSAESIVKEVERRISRREAVSTSVEMPFSPGTKRALQCAVEEANWLRHSYVGTEHLLLGLLRDEASLAAAILTAQGLLLAPARAQIVNLIAEGAETAAGSRLATRLVSLDDQVEQIKRLVELLLQAPAGSDEARDLGDRVRRDLDTLKRNLIG